LKGLNNRMGLNNNLKGLNNRMGLNNNRTGLNNYKYSPSNYSPPPLTTPPKNKLNNTINFGKAPSVIPPPKNVVLNKFIKNLNREQKNLNTIINSKIEKK